MSENNKASANPSLTILDDNVPIKDVKAAVVVDDGNTKSSSIGTNPNDDGKRVSPSDEPNDASLSSNPSLTLLDDSTIVPTDVKVVVVDGNTKESSSIKTDLKDDKQASSPSDEANDASNETKACCEPPPFGVKGTEGDDLANIKLCSNGIVDSASSPVVCHNNDDEEEQILETTASILDASLMELESIPPPRSESLVVSTTMVSLPAVVGAVEGYSIVIDTKSNGDDNGAVASLVKPAAATLHSKSSDGTSEIVCEEGSDGTNQTTICDEIHKEPIAPTVPMAKIIKDTKSVDGDGEVASLVEPAAATVPSIPDNNNNDIIMDNTNTTNVENNNKNNEQTWHSFFLMLQAHRVNTGSFDIPIHSNPPLEAWVLRQREQYHQSVKDDTIKSDLTRERRLLLDALQFDWNLKNSNTNTTSPPIITTTEELHPHQTPTPNNTTTITTTTAITTNQSHMHKGIDGTSENACEEGFDDGTTQTMICEEEVTHKEPMIPTVFEAKTTPVSSIPTHTNHKTNNITNRFYALRKGKSTSNCIYLQQSHMADQIQDFPEAQHAVFDEWKDAVAFLQNDNDPIGKASTIVSSSVDSPARSIATATTAQPPEKRTYTSANGGDHPAGSKCSSPPQLDNGVGCSSISTSSAAQSSQKRKGSTDDSMNTQARTKPRYEGTTIRNNEATSITLKRETTNTAPAPIPMPPLSPNKYQSSDVYVSVYNNESWDAMYENLQTFHADTGTIDVPPSSRLGVWITQQRKHYQTFLTNGGAGGNNNNHQSSSSWGDLTQERMEKLTSMNFLFTSAKKALQFEQRVEEWVKFREESGGATLDPPSNTLLYKWVYSMRRKYRYREENKHVFSALDRIKIKRLDDIGFSWISEKEHRKLCLQQQTTNTETTKDSLVEMTTKTSTKAKKETISKKELRWNELFEQLKTFKEENGNFTVTRHGSTLGRWVSSQRLAYRKFNHGGNYPPIFNEEKIEKLMEIGFDFECKRGRKSGVEDSSAWDVMYDEMQKFKEEHGHCIPPTQPSTPLRRWVEKQRTEYKKIRAGEDSHLTLLRIQRLNDIDFSFEAKCKPKTWEERYDELVVFKAKFGHCKVPRLYNGLGKWVADQRQKYSKLMQGKKTNMTQEKAQKLTDLGMIWVVFKLPPKEERAERKPWAERFQELLAFQNIHGHTVVPQHFPVLGHWVHTQRVHYKLMKQGRKSLMTPEQAFQLADIGFTFEVMPRKKSTIRQSLGNPYPHLPLIASAGTTECTEVAQPFPENELTDANLDQLKDENASYQNAGENILYNNKDDGVPYQSRGDGVQYHSKDDEAAYGIENTFDEYGI